MLMFILLTADQADQVRGRSITTPTAALNPIQRQGGVSILGVEVLADPAHESHRGVLSLLPQLDSSDPSFPAAMPSVDA